MLLLCIDVSFFVYSKSFSESQKTPQNPQESSKLSAVEFYCWHQNPRPYTQTKFMRNDLTLSIRSHFLYPKNWEWKYPTPSVASGSHPILTLPIAIPQLCWHWHFSLVSPLPLSLESRLYLTPISPNVFQRHWRCFPQNIPVALVRPLFFVFFIKKQVFFLMYPTMFDYYVLLH